MTTDQHTLSNILSDNILLQVPLPASTGTPALPLCLPLRPICQASTTTFASDEPEVPVPSVTVPTSPPPLRPPPSGSVLEDTHPLLPLPPGVSARESRPSVQLLQVIQDLETIWTFWLSSRALEVPGLLELPVLQSTEFAGQFSTWRLMLPP